MNVFVGESLAEFPSGCDVGGAEYEVDYLDGGVDDPRPAGFFGVGLIEEAFVQVEKYPKASVGVGDFLDADFDALIEVVEFFRLVYEALVVQRRWSFRRVL